MQFIIIIIIVDNLVALYASSSSSSLSSASNDSLSSLDGRVSPELADDAMEEELDEFISAEEDAALTDGNAEGQLIEDDEFLGR